MRISTFDDTLGIDFDAGLRATGGGLFSTVFLTVLVTALAAVFGAGFAGALATVFGAGFVFAFTTLFGAGFAFATTFFGTGLALAFTLPVATRVPTVTFLPLAFAFGFAFAFAVTNFNSPETHYRRIAGLPDMGNSGNTKTRKCTETTQRIQRNYFGRLSAGSEKLTGPRARKQARSSGTCPESRAPAVFRMHCSNQE